jgi:hypothetical protein
MAGSPKASTVVVLGITGLVAAGIALNVVDTDDVEQAICVDPATELRVDDDLCEGPLDRDFDDDGDDDGRVSGSWRYYGPGQSYPAVGAKGSGGKAAAATGSTVRKGGSSAGGIVETGGFGFSGKSSGS